MQITLTKVDGQPVLLVGAVRKRVVPISDLHHVGASFGGDESYQITINEDLLIEAMRSPGVTEKRS